MSFYIAKSIVDYKSSTNSPMDFRKLQLPTATPQVLRASSPFLGAFLHLFDLLLQRVEFRR